jgi:hypothetical protein
MLASIIFDQRSEEIPLMVIKNHSLKARVLTVWNNCHLLSVELFAFRTKQTENKREHYSDNLQKKTKEYNKYIGYKAGFLGFLFKEAQRHQRKHFGNDKPRTICSDKKNQLPFRVTLWSKDPNDPQLARVFIHFDTQLKEVDGKTLYQCIELNAEQVDERIDTRSLNIDELKREEGFVRRANSKGLIQATAITQFTNKGQTYLSAIKPKIPYNLEQMDKLKVPAKVRLGILLQIVRNLLACHDKGHTAGDLSLEEIGIDFTTKNVTLNNLAEVQEFTYDWERWPDFWSLGTILPKILPDEHTKELPQTARAVLKWIQHQLTMDVLQHNLIPTKWFYAGLRLFFALTIDKKVTEHWNSLKRLYQVEILAHWDAEADLSVSELLETLGEKRLPPYDRAKQRRFQLCYCDNPSIDQLFLLAPRFIRKDDRLELASYLKEHPNLDTLSPLSRAAVRYFATSNLSYTRGIETLELAQASPENAVQTAKIMELENQKQFLPWLLHHGDLKDPPILRVIEALAKLNAQALACLNDDQRPILVDEILTELKKTQADMDLVGFLHHCGHTKDWKKATAHLQKVKGYTCQQLLSHILSNYDLTLPDIDTIVFLLVEKSPDALALLLTKNQHLLKQSRSFRLHCIKAILPKVTCEQMNSIHKLVITWLRPEAEEKDYAEAVSGLEATLLPSKAPIEDIRTNSLNRLVTVIALQKKTERKDSIDGARSD